MAREVGHGVVLGGPRGLAAPGLRARARDSARGERYLEYVAGAGAGVLNLHAGQSADGACVSVAGELDR